MATGSEIKAEQRIFFTKKRAALKKSDLHSKSKAVQESFLQLQNYKNSSVVMLYIAKDNEVQTGNAIEQALKDKKKVLLPFTDIKEKRLIPKLFSGKLRKGAYGIPEPVGRPIESSSIDVVVVPVIAFDSECRRIGRGLGYYDRFLKGLRAVKVGFAFHCQEAENIPQEEHDVRLDIIITETRIIKNGRD